MLNTESALAMTTHILWPHVHVKTGQIGTHCVNTFSPSSSTGQNDSEVTYHRAMFTAYLSIDVESLKKHFDGSPVFNLNDDSDVHDAELIQQSAQNL